MDDARHIVPDDDQVAAAIVLDAPVADEVALTAVAAMEVAELVVGSPHLHVVQHRVHEQAPEALVLEPGSARRHRHDVALGKRVVDEHHGAHGGGLDRR